MVVTKAKTRLQTHTGINRKWGVVEEGILYNREVIEENMHFWGMVKVPDTLVSTFEDFIEEVMEEQLVRLGTGRTRGLGKVAITVEPIEDEQDNLGAFEERLVKFHELLKVQAKGFGLKDLKPFYFTVTLHAPVILHDPLLNYQGSIDGEMLAKRMQLPPFELVYQKAGGQRVAGWQDLWGTPRTHEYAIDTGSVFLFASTHDLDNQGFSQMRKRAYLDCKSTVW
jgi:CRISPR-associated protein Csx10